jgi:hypothetical protein
LERRRVKEIREGKEQKGAEPNRSELELNGYDKTRRGVEVLKMLNFYSSNRLQGKRYSLL